MPGSEWWAVSWPAEALKSWPPSGDVRVICEIPFGTASRVFAAVQTLQSGKMLARRAGRVPASESAECGKCLAASGGQFPGRQRSEALKSWPSGDVRVICEIPFGVARFGLGRTSDNQDLIHSLYVDDSQGCLRSVFPASTRMAAGSAWQRVASSFLAGRGTEALKSWPPSGDVRVICEIPFGAAWFGLGRTSDNQDLIHSLHVDDSQGCLRSVFPASTRMQREMPGSERRAVSWPAEALKP